MNALSNRNKTKTMKTLFTLSALTLLSIVGFTQSPGGVSSGLVAWLKPDASGMAPAADGSAVTTWNDASGLGHSATQATAAARPLYYSNQFNGHAAIRTSSTRFFNIDLSDINDTNYTIITVSKRLGSVGYVVGYSGATSSTGLALGYAGSTLARHSQYANWVNMTVPANDPASELPVILACQFDELVGKRAWRINDGTNTLRSSSNRTHYALTGAGRIGRGMANDGFSGFISEVIVFNRVLSAAELKQIHTYLSVKYGLSVPVADHLYALDATHQNDVFGIGRNNASALNQSTSESAGMDDLLRLSSPSSLSDGDYLICGNDNGAALFAAYGGSNCTFNTVLSRDWKFRHVGDVGTVDLRFDMTGMAGFTATELRLLIDLDGDGYDDETPVTGSYSAPYFTVSGVTIPNGVKITLCQEKSHYYAVASGLTSGAIWADSPAGTPGVLSSTCEQLDLTIVSGVVVNNDWTSMSCKNLAVESGATFNAGALVTQNIHVSGDITVNGVWNDQNSTLNSDGDVAQVINGTGYLRVQSWAITNAAGVTIDGLGVILYGNLGVSNGAILHTNGKLSLWSDINGTAEIQSLTAGSIDGEVSIRRYRPAATAGWVNLTSSLQDATIEEWDASILTTGFTGSDNPAYSFNSVVYYDETVAGADEDGYVEAENSSDLLVPGRGYMVYMPTGAYTVVARGPINSGTINLNPTYTDNGSGAGWNLVGNPYPASVDWDAEDWTKTNMNNAVYIWRSNINQYATYINGVSANGGSALIAPGQSFFVEATGPAPQLIVTEDCKSKSAGTFRTMEMLPAHMSMKLSMGDWQDETILVKNETSADIIEARKLRSPMNQAPYLASIDESGKNLSINSIRMEGTGQIIPMRIEAGVSGTYTLQVNGLAQFAQGACVTLEDVFTNTTYVLSENEPIELPLEAGDRTQRYQLRITGNALSAVTSAGCAANAGGSAEVTIESGSGVYVEWLNEDGGLIARTTSVNGVASVQSLRPGYYVARIANNGACTNTEVGFEINEMNTLGATAIAMPATCENTNDGGLLVNISGGRAPYAITWENGTTGQTIDNAVAGKYKAQIVDADGCSSDFEFEIETVSNLLSKFEVSHENVELQNGEAIVDFTNVSESADSYNWNFGDGSENSTDENPTHAYIQAGVYEVMLKATHDNCESVSTKTIAVADNNRSEEFASNVLAALTDRGVQVTFLFDELKNIRINAYNVLGQQLIEPIVGQYGNQTITFGDSRYAANALIEVTDVNTGERSLIRLGR